MASCCSEASSTRICMGRCIRSMRRARPRGRMSGSTRTGALVVDLSARAGPDVACRMSGIWGSGTPLEEYLVKHDIKTTFWSGVNADQCVLGSVVDAYSLGYDIIAVEDTIATTSPAGAKENLIYNSIRVSSRHPSIRVQDLICSTELWVCYRCRTHLKGGLCLISSV